MEIPARAMAGNVVEEIFKKAVEIGEINLIWREMTNNDRIMKEIEIRI